MALDGDLLVADAFGDDTEGPDAGAAPAMGRGIVPGVDPKSA